MPTIKSLRLKNFRNYPSVKIDLQQGVFLIIGENSSGKTSLLEAIYYTVLLHSFKTRTIQQLKLHGENNFEINLSLVDKNNFTTELACSYNRQRELFINRKKIYKINEYFSRLNIITFLPEDIQIIFNNTHHKRKYLDLFFSQVSTSYLSNFTHYQKVLKMYNKALKDNSSDAVLNSLRKLLAKYGAVVLFARQEYIPQLKTFFLNYCKTLFPRKEISLKYIVSIDNLGDSLKEIEQNYLQELQNNISSDQQYLQLNIGVHRDELKIAIDGKDASVFASQGEARLLALILKLSQIDFLKDIISCQDFVLLVDDVLGELDLHKEKLFFDSIINNPQVFITCTHHPEYFSKLMPDKDFFEIFTQKIKEI